MLGLMYLSSKHPIIQTKKCDAEKIKDLPQIILLESGQTGYAYKGIDRFQALSVNISIHLRAVQMLF